MGSMITRARKITLQRIGTQLLMLVFINLPFLNMRGVCAPVFYCHSCPLANMACPLGVLTNFSALGLFPFAAVGILAMVGVLGGRFVCGWLCPFGFLQDMLYKIRSRKLHLPHVTTYLKYVILIAFVIVMPFVFRRSDRSFCSLCPSGTLEAAIPYAIQNGKLSLAFFLRAKVLVLFGILAFAIVAERSFCRTLCPLGAIFSVFNRFSLFRFRLAFQKCPDCGVCEKACPVGIHPVQQMNHEECVRCFDCTANKHIRIGVK